MKLSCLLLGALVAVLPASGASLYVLNERAQSIAVVDLSSNSVVATISLADPDGDGRPDPPADLTLSTLPSHSNDHAFVAQGRFLRVVNLSTRTVVRTHDVALMLGLGDLDLAACESAPPRLHIQPATGMPVLRSYLHLAATMASGEARFIVYDQQMLFLTTAGPPAGHGLLGLDATALGVKVLEEPSGPMFQRAWYQTRSRVGGTSLIHAVLVQSARLAGSAWAAVSTSSIPVHAPPGSALRMGAPWGGGELPVLPTGQGGSLRNLDTGEGCPIGGDVVAASVSGPGLASYTILAVRNDTSELVEVNGKDCSTTTFATGASPVDVATLGAVDWVEAFTANRDGDSVTRVKRDGSVLTIPIGSGGGTCVACPTALAAPSLACAPTDLRMDVRDADADGQDDDLHLQWNSSGCASATLFHVYCSCRDDSPNCPCPCDCSLPVPPAGCACPGTAGLTLAPSGSIQIEPDVQIQENPWKILGITAGTSFDALGLGASPDSFDVNVTAGPMP